MIKALLPYTILFLSWGMLLLGGAYLSHPLFGMFSLPIILFGSLTILAFFIGIVPSIDDVLVTEGRKNVGSVLIVLGSVLLGVVAYLYGKELAGEAGPGAVAANLNRFMLWIACWVLAPLVLGVGAALKSKWSYGRVIPLVLIFAVQVVVMPVVVPKAEITAAVPAGAAPLTAGEPAQATVPQNQPASR